MSTWDLPLRPEVYSLLTALVEEHFGFDYGPDDVEIFQGKVSLRARELGYESLLDYYYFLRYDADGADEIVHLGELLTVNESYLFREADPLVHLVEHELVPAVERGARPRVWSAACANGEEPFTLAMLLAEAKILDQVELIASDVSKACLARARSGELGRRAVRGVPRPELLERWVDTDARRVDPALVGRIDFRRVNLLHPEAVASVGPCDAILCRNVLIYFTDEVRRTVVARFVEQLRPGGTLLVGVSESLLRLGARLECEERGGIFLYRRRTS